MKVSEDEKKNQIALSLIEGVGDKIGKKLLAYFGSAKAILIESEEDIIKGLNWDVKEKVIQQKIYKKNIYFFCFLEKYYTFAQN